MSKIRSAIEGFFFAPPEAPFWRHALPFVVLGVATFALIGATVQGWTYTNSPEFCGMACHTMPPEYSAYLRSPHARVQCVECHLGREVVTTQFTRKAGDLRHVIATVTQDYEYPIRAHDMRPARDSCEKCHFPQKFSDDSLREVLTYGNDEQNSPQRTYLVMNTGGGAKREGLGRGIHWHIENEVWFMPGDELEQEIPYVRTVDDEGNVVEYYDIASGVTPDDVAGTFLEEMDCMTCHNRITHKIPDPGESIDLSIRKGLIQQDLPFVREKSVELLSQPYSDRIAAGEAFGSLEGFYATNYPDIAASRADDIGATIQTLNEIYDLSVFPEQKLDWNSHPDNLGHKEDPGCFRCHDGKHLTGTGEAIRLECNLCHAIPVVSDGTSLVTEIELSRGPEPPSHTLSSWIILHGKSIDSSCAACHEPADPAVDYTQMEGKPPPDGSFCGNVGCHGPDWQYSGLDSPMLQPYIDRQLYTLRNTSPYLLDGVARTYEETFKALFDGRCIVCHGAPEYKADLDLSTYEGILKGGKNGPALIPGTADESLIILRQSQSTEHGGQVLDDELEALTDWISNGAPEK